jgi:antitoxin YxxD
VFEFMSDIVEYSRNHPESPNVFFPVSQGDVLEAEARLGRVFPDELKAFFKEIGCGFLKAGLPERSRTRFNYLNRFLDPREIADVSSGIDEDLTPSEGFAANELPFFEIADQLYLVFRSSGDRPNAICWSLGREIAPDLAEFVRQLTIDPRFYHSSISPFS